MPAEYPLLGIVRHRMEVDGAGVTTLVAGAGCPLRCRYCINRDVLQKAPKPVTPAQLYARVKIDDLYFRATGGGITFGGGEALLHMDFYEAFRPLCPDWKLCAETCLHVPKEAVVRAAKIFDSFIVDIKSTDPEIYKRYTGADLSPALENLVWLFQHFDPEKVTVRVPLIPDFNTVEQQQESVNTVKALGAVRIDAFQYLVR